MMRVPIVRRRNTTGGGTSWTPAAITNLFEWWIADPSYLAYDGSNRVSAWTGAYAGRTLTQGTLATQPTYVSSDADLGSKPSLSFNGSQWVQDSGAASDWGWWVRTDAPGGATDALVAVVARYTRSPTALTRMLGCGATPPGAGIQINDHSDPSFTISYTTTRGGTAIAMLPQNTPSSFWYAHSSSCATSATVRGRASNNAYTTASTTFAATTSDPANAMRVGAYPGFGLWEGKIAEVVFAKTPLTEALAAQFASYFSARYGL